MQNPVIIWFRQDLRLQDNPAFFYAAQSSSPIIPLFILDDTLGLQPGDASLWWLGQSLEKLRHDLKSIGLFLILRRGNARQILHKIIQQTGSKKVYWNRCYEPDHIKRDKAIKSDLNENAIQVISFNGSLLAEPWAVKNGAGLPYRVFTPFWKSMQDKIDPMPPLSIPSGLTPYEKKLSSNSLKRWNFSPHWAGKLSKHWKAGERSAHQKLNHFISSDLSLYSEGRDYPDRPHTSLLSPHLHWGEISPRQIIHAATAYEGNLSDLQKFKSELGWRDFSYHLMYHFPHITHQNLRQNFDLFPWIEDEQKLTAWQRGETGIPLVDAGMRQLWETGYMHNRVRMITASFLVKHLMQPWQEGAKWFWDTLVDADLASNSASWQWVAGSGADASPFFRIFNPVVQGKKFDPKGGYIRRWVPELLDVSDRYIHSPWEMATPPLHYPPPIIDLGYGRERALAAYKAIK